MSNCWKSHAVAHLANIPPKMVTTLLFCFPGSQDVAANWDILEKYKVTHILNVATWVNNSFPKNIKYKNLNIMDTVDFHILPYFDVAFPFIDEGRREGCVLVHCNAGISRAATFSIGYLMKTEGMTFLEAFKHVKEKRPSAWPNSGFKVQLETYGERLHSSRAT